MNGAREENGHDVDLTSEGGEDTEEVNPITDIDESTYGVHTTPMATIPGTVTKEGERKKEEQCSSLEAFCLANFHV